MVASAMAFKKFHFPEHEDHIPSEGLPPLPQMDISLHVPTSPANEAAPVFADYIRQSLKNRNPYKNSGEDSLES